MTAKLYENIKALRKKQHITQEQLAEAVGVNVGAVYKWEQNLSSPDIHTIMELASFFGVLLDALVGYEMQDPTADGLCGSDLSVTAAKRVFCRRC